MLGSVKNEKGIIFVIWRALDTVSYFTGCQKTDN